MNDGAAEMDVASNNQRGDHDGWRASRHSRRRTVPYRKRGVSALDAKSTTPFFILIILCDLRGKP